MPPINDNDPARQSAIALSEHFGRLAASPAVRAEAAFPQLDPSISPWLASILSHFRRRAREHAAAKLRANEFMGP
jgi:hypothetical protein